MILEALVQAAVAAANPPEATITLQTAATAFAGAAAYYLARVALRLEKKVTQLLVYLFGPPEKPGSGLVGRFERVVTDVDNCVARIDALTKPHNPGNVQ